MDRKTKDPLESYIVYLLCVFFSFSLFKTLDKNCKLHRAVLCNISSWLHWREICQCYTSKYFSRCTTGLLQLMLTQFSKALSCFTGSCVKFEKFPQAMSHQSDDGWGWRLQIWIEPKKEKWIYQIPTPGCLICCRLQVACYFSHLASSTKIWIELLIVNCG